MSLTRRTILENNANQSTDGAATGAHAAVELPREPGAARLSPNVLEIFATPVFIVDKSGAILDGNVFGMHLLRNHHDVVEHALAELVACGRPSIHGPLVPLHGIAGEQPRFLAALRLPLAGINAGDRTPLVRTRWKFTRRQQQVIALILQGLTNSEIGKALGVMEGTVEFHISAIFAKTGVENRATLIAHLLLSCVRRQLGGVLMRPPPLAYIQTRTRPP